MKLQRNELIIIAVVIGYIAFFTHPPPSHITNLLESPIGHAIILLGILYVVAYQSLIVGIFLGIAYIMTAIHLTEYFVDRTDPRPAPEIVDRGVPKFGEDTRSMTKINDDRLSRGQKSISESDYASYETDQVKSSQEKALKNKVPTSSGVPKPNAVGVVGEAMKNKGDTRLPQKQEKNVDPRKSATIPPKPAMPTSKEGFGNFAAF